jgi:AAA15 family ATPase/GTPase
MSEHFIKNIEIKNFKCFDNFKAEGFGRVNLIGGKNNVGKTAFMEACYVNVSSETISNMLFSLSKIYRDRDKLNICHDEFNIITMLEKYQSFNLQSINSISYIFNTTSINRSLTIELNGIQETIDFTTQINFSKNQNVIFIDNFGFTNYELKEIYKPVQLQDKDTLLNEYITNFDKTITQFKIISDIPYLQCSGEYYSLNNFGDGIKQYISIIASLYASRDKYLFIDEIENGIHYTNLDKLWEIILTISKEQNVQVFATTHSKECIESYARVAKKLEDEEITFIELGRNDENKIESIIYPYEWLMDEVEQNHEVRGW